MATVMAQWGRVKRTVGESCRKKASELYRTIKLALLLPLAAPVVYAQPAPPPQQLVFRPYHASGLYDVGDTVGWIVSPGPAAPTYSYKWTIRRNNKDVLKEGKLDLSSGKDRIETVGDQPEMIYVAIEPYGNFSGDNAVKDGGASAATNAGPAATPAFVGGNTGRNNGLYAVGAAVAPGKLGLSTARRPTLMHSGTQNWRHKPRSPLTRALHRSSPTSLASRRACLLSTPWDRRYTGMLRSLQGRDDSPRSFNFSMPGFTRWILTGLRNTPQMAGW